MLQRASRPAGLRPSAELRMEVTRFSSTGVRTMLTPARAVCDCTWRDFATAVQVIRRMSAGCKDGVIGGMFGLIAQTGRRHPHQRMKPEQADHSLGEYLPTPITARNMSLFVANSPIAFFLRPIQGVL